VLSSEYERNGRRGQFHEASYTVQVRNLDSLE